MQVKKFLPEKISQTLLATTFLGILLCWVYTPVFISLAQRWAQQSQYSHGFLVPLFSLFLLWARRDRLVVSECQPSWWGLTFLIGGLALHFAGSVFYFDWFSQISLLPCLVGLCVVAGGWRSLQWSWPAIVFLFFMVPLPFRLETALAYPLQRVATLASTFTLQMLGFVAFAQGNVIHFGEHQIGIVEACNGLSMLVVFFALSAAIILVVQMSWPEKGIILASAIPIAVIANVTRIVVTALLYQVSTAEFAHMFFHDLAGWMMIMFALGLLWIELRIFSWLLVPVQDTEDIVKSSFAGLQGPTNRETTPVGAPTAFFHGEPTTNKIP